MFHIRKKAWKYDAGAILFDDRVLGSLRQM